LNGNSRTHGFVNLLFGCWAGPSSGGVRVTKYPGLHHRRIDRSLILELLSEQLDVEVQHYLSKVDDSRNCPSQFRNALRLGVSSSEDSKRDERHTRYCSCFTATRLDGSLNPSVTLSFMKTKVKVSKQRRWQIAKLEAGRCAICGKKRKHYKYHCDPCQEKHRKAKRRLTGNKPYSGSKGSAPFVKDRNPGHPRRVRGGR